MKLQVVAIMFTALYWLFTIWFLIESKYFCKERRYCDLALLIPILPWSLILRVHLNEIVYYFPTLFILNSSIIYGSIVFFQAIIETTLFLVKDKPNKKIKRIYKLSNEKE